MSLEDQLAQIFHAGLTARPELRDALAAQIGQVQAGAAKKKVPKKKDMTDGSPDATDAAPDTKSPEPDQAVPA